LFRVISNFTEEVRL